MSYFLTTGEDQNKQHWTFWTPIKATYLRQSWRYKDSKAGSWDSKAKCGVVNGALRTNRIPIKFHKLGAHTVLAFRCDGASTARALMLDCWNSATAERGCDSHHEGSTAGGLRACPHTATGRATNVRTFFPCFKATRASRRYNENGSTARLLQRHRGSSNEHNTKHCQIMGHLASPPRPPLVTPSLTCICTVLVEGNSCRFPPPHHRTSSNDGVFFPSSIYLKMGLQILSLQHLPYILNNDWREIKNVHITICFPTKSCRMKYKHLPQLQELQVTMWSYEKIKLWEIE
jgi:hypothetical protein